MGIFFVVEECSRIWRFLGRFQERPGMAGEENSSMAGSGFFPEFPAKGMESVKKVLLVLQKLHSLTKGINMLISSLNSPFKTIVFSEVKAILCCKSCKPTLLIPVDSASLFYIIDDTIKEEPNTLISSDVSITLIPFRALQQRCNLTYHC